MADFPFTRLRRMRAQSFTRRLMRETHLSTDDLILPVFICEGSNQEQSIGSLPEVYRYSIDRLTEQADKWLALDIPSVVLFPCVGKSEKSIDAKAAYDPNGLVQQAIKKVKEHAPSLGIITDVALDPYTSHGHDGLIDDKGYVDNDITIEVLVKQALSHVDAGADIVGPSDMMDGRIGAIRQAFEHQGFKNKMILSYAAKFASSYYAPFREAVIANIGDGDKKTYQLDPANRIEALREVELDINEGADMVMVKPGLPYLDVIRDVKDNFSLPTFAYQVSGEYAMLMAAVNNGWLQKKPVVMESMLSLKRAGADAVLSYFAMDIARWLKQQ